MNSKIYFIILTLFTSNFSIYTSLNIQNTHFTKEPKSNEIIIKINITQFDKDGYPTTEALKKLFDKYYQNSQTSITIHKIGGGYYTEKMYAANAPIWHFKISKKKDTIDKLMAIQTGKIGQTIKTNAPSLPGFPIIVWLEHVFEYENSKKQKEFIAITKTADGQLVKDILEEDDERKIQKCAEHIGKSLAQFHILFMPKNMNTPLWPTICHGDFTIKNILFNDETNTTYFIDNEDMGSNSIATDLKPILTGLFLFQYLQEYYNKLKRHEASSIKNRWSLYLSHCKSFLTGYIESYPENKRHELALFIETILEEALDEIIDKGIIRDHGITGEEFNRTLFKKEIYENLLYNYSFKKTPLKQPVKKNS